MPGNSSNGSAIAIDLPLLSLNSTFRWQFNAAEQEKFLSISTVLAPLAVGAVVVAALVLRKARWDPRNLAVAVGRSKWLAPASAGRGSWIDDDDVTAVPRRSCCARCCDCCCPHRRIVWCCSSAASIFVALPLVVLAVWSVWVAIDVQPTIGGIAMLTTWPATLLLAFGLLSWRARMFRTDEWRSDNVGPVKFGIGAAAVLYSAYEFSLVLMTRYNFVGAAWAFMGVNMAIMCRVVADIVLVPPSDTLEGHVGRLASVSNLLTITERSQMSRTMRHSASQMTLVSGSGSKSDLHSGVQGGLARNRSQASMASARSGTTAHTHGLVPISGSFAMAAVNAHNQHTEEERLRAKVARDKERAPARLYQYLTANYLYGVALLVLLAFAMVHWPMSETVVDSKAAGSDTAKVFGFVLLASVFVLDMACYFLHKARFFKSPGHLLAVMGLARFALCVWGQDLWLLGFTTVYLVFALVLSHQVANELLEWLKERDEVYEDILRREKHEKLVRKRSERKRAGDRIDEEDEFDDDAVGVEVVPVMKLGRDGSQKSVGGLGAIAEATGTTLASGADDSAASTPKGDGAAAAAGLVEDSKALGDGKTLVAAPAAGLPPRPRPASGHGTHRGDGHHTHRTDRTTDKGDDVMSVDSGTTWRSGATAARAARKKHRKRHRHIPRHTRPLRTTPFVLFAVFNACFLLATLGVRIGGSPMPKVPLFSADHEQYEFGVAAILAVGVYSLWMITYRVTFRNSQYRTWTRKSATLSVASTFLSYGLNILAGWVLVGITNSRVPLAMSFFLPPAFVFGYFSLSMWRKADYDFFVDAKPGRVPKTATWSLEAFQTLGEFRDRTVDHPTLRNTLTLSATLLSVGSMAGFGYYMSTIWETPWVGWVFAMVPTQVVCTWIPLVSWFNTFEVDVIEILFGLAAVAMLGGIHMLWYLHSTDSLGWIILSAGTYVGVTGIIGSVVKMIDDGKVDTIDLVGFFGSQIVVVGAIAAGLFLQADGDVSNSLTVVIVWAVALVLGGVTTRWVSNGFYLRRAIAIPLKLLFACAVLGATAVAGIEYSNDSTVRALGWFSLAYLMVLVFVVVNAIPALRMGHRSGQPLFFSATLFPVYGFHTTNNSVVRADKGPALLLLAFFMTFAWGLCATLFVEPASVGLGIMGVSKVVALAYCTAMARRAPIAFAKALNQLRVSKEPGRLDAVLAEAVQAERNVMTELRKQANRVTTAGLVRRLRHVGAEKVRRDDYREAAKASGNRRGSSHSAREAAAHAKHNRHRHHREDRAHVLFSEVFISRALLERERVLLQKLKAAMQGPKRLQQDTVARLYQVGADGAGARDGSVVVNIDSTGDEIGRGSRGNSAPNSAEHTPRGQAPTSGAMAQFSKAQAMGFVSLRPILTELDSLQQELRAALLEEAMFRANVHRTVVSAGAGEADKEKAQWVSFLRWCANPAQAPVLGQFGMPELADMAARISKNEKGRDVFLSDTQAVDFWKNKYGLRGGVRMAARLESLQGLFEITLDEQEARNEARRREAERAEEQRAERMRARRLAESGGPGGRLGGSGSDVGDSFGSVRTAGETGPFTTGYRDSKAAPSDAAEKDVKGMGKAAMREAGSAHSLDKGASSASLAATQKEASAAQAKAALALAREARGPTDEEILAEVNTIKTLKTDGDGHFEDREFRGDAALGDERIKALVGGWAHAESIAREGPPAVIVDECDPRDVRQGTLGDCYLLSAMSVVSQRRELIDNVLVVEEGNPEGIYAVRLFKNGAWHRVIIDDLFPTVPNAYVDKEGVLRTGEWKGYDTRFAAPAFAHSAVSNELWLMIIEKAYAKYHGSYADIEGGLVHNAMVDLTGGNAEFYHLRSQEVKSMVDNGSLWTKLHEYDKEGHLLAAGSPPGDDTDVSHMGIVQGHAYAVLKVAEVSDTNGTHKLLQLRNPWGHGEWKGDWSDTDTERWTKRMCVKLGHDMKGTAEDDDGIFWMSFDDFVENFADLYVCRIPRTVDMGGEWHRYMAFGSWKGATAAGCTNNPGSEANPQFWIPVRKQCKVFLSLSQVEEPGKPLVPIGFYVMKKKGKRVKCRFGGETVATAKYAPAREVTADFELKPRREPYTLFVSTYAKDQEADFRITLYSTQPLGATLEGNVLEQIPDSVEAK